MNLSVRLSIFEGRGIDRLSEIGDFELESVSVCYMLDSCPQIIV